jgi:hypothetical protein
MRFSLLLAVWFALPAHAVLILSGPAPDNSNAIQVQNRFLGLNNGSVQSACVLLDSLLPVSSASRTFTCGAGFAGGDHDANKSKLLSISEAGILDAADLRLTFDAVEPGGNSITIERLALFFYDGVSGALLTGSAVELAPVPMTLSSTNEGNGKPELVFRLDQTSINLLTAAGFNANTIVGMAVNFSGASGGPETFYLANQFNSEGIPEPGTWVLGATALGLLCLNRRKRRPSPRSLPEHACTASSPSAA